MSKKKSQQQKVSWFILLSDLHAPDGTKDICAFVKTVVCKDKG